MYPIEAIQCCTKLGGERCLDKSQYRNLDSVGFKFLRCNVPKSIMSEVLASFALVQALTTSFARAQVSIEIIEDSSQSAGRVPQEIVMNPEEREIEIICRMISSSESSASWTVETEDNESFQGLTKMTRENENEKSFNFLFQLRNQILHFMIRSMKCGENQTRPKLTIALKCLLLPRSMELTQMKQYPGSCFHFKYSKTASFGCETPATRGLAKLRTSSVRVSKTFL